MFPLHELHNLKRKFLGMTSPNLKFIAGKGYFHSSGCIWTIVLYTQWIPVQVLSWCSPCLLQHKNSLLQVVHVCKPALCKGCNLEPWGMGVIDTLQGKMWHPLEGPGSKTKDTSWYRGHYITNPIYRTFVLFDSPKTGNSMTRVVWLQRFH